jgi:hypothetical protein
MFWIYRGVLRHWRTLSNAYLHDDVPLSIADALNEVVSHPLDIGQSCAQLASLQVTLPGITCTAHTHTHIHTHKPTEHPATYSWIGTFKDHAHATSCLASIDVAGPTQVIC